MKVNTPYCILEKITVNILGAKGQMASNINIHYRPIPKKAQIPKNLEADKKQNHLKIELFTETM